MTQWISTPYLTSCICFSLIIIFLNPNFSLWFRLPFVWQALIACVLAGDPCIYTLRALELLDCSQLLCFVACYPESHACFPLSAVLGFGRGVDVCNNWAIALPDLSLIITCGCNGYFSAAAQKTKMMRSASGSYNALFRHFIPRDLHWYFV